MLTVVSTLLPGLSPENGREDWLEVVRRLHSARLPLVLYVDPALTAELGEALQAGPTLVRGLDAADLRNGIWLTDELTALLDDAECSAKDRVATLVRLRSMAWLHDESVFNPFATDAFLWVAPWTLDSLNAAYLAEPDLLASVEPLLSRMLLLRQPGREADACVSPDLFGGSAQTLSRVNQSYWHRYGAAIERGEIPSFEGIMAELATALPDDIRHHVLQSNGLVGALFESLRSGRVRLEERYLAG